MVTPETSVTRSEERLLVQRIRRPYMRVMLRKVVVTEDVTITVKVRREELRVESIPLSGVEQDTDPGEGLELSEGFERDIVLHAERPVVTLQTVPVERVRVSRELVTTGQQVDAEIRVERVEIDGTPSTAGDDQSPADQVAHEPT